jgi:hypothetical protein|nr:MAG TPA: hypothetical protein [Caudoviricetes sp.]
MAEQIIFGADIDNVTIKNINGKLTAVIDVENAADEFEVVTNYEEPVEDDDYYVESTFAKFRHKATQLMTDAFKKEKKPRSAPVNESFSEPITTEALVGDTSIAINFKNAIFTSAIDGYGMPQGDLNGDYTEIVLNKADYANAKAFNTAHAGKTFTVTTKKRYAESEGHPVVKPTEIQVAYPTLPYEEHTYAPETGTSSYNLEYVPRSYDDTETIELNTLLALMDSTEHEVSYVVRYPDGSEISGTHTYTGNYLNRFEVSGYKNEQSSYERWEFKPYIVENFNGKLTVSPQTYTEGTL